MKWLRTIARRLAKANRGLAWTAPTGFPVVHESREPRTVRVKTSDRTFVLCQEDEKPKIDSRKQADGIVAHLVHSQDAAHMMLTIDPLQTEGVRHFAMVHDSFGVDACDIDVLNRVLREEFVRMYSEPVMMKFFKQQWEANPACFSRTPSAGESRYSPSPRVAAFFCLRIVNLHGVFQICIAICKFARRFPD